MDKLLIPSSIKAIALDFDGTTMKFKFTEGLRQEAYRRAIQSVGLELLGRRLTKSEINQCHGPALGNSVPADAPIANSGTPMPSAIANSATPPSSASRLWLM